MAGEKHKNATTWKKGQTPNPGGRSPKVGPNGETVAQLARGHTAECIERVMKIVRAADDELSLKAAHELLDRGWGRAKESVELDANVKSNTPVINFTVTRANEDGGA